MCATWGGRCCFRTCVLSPQASAGVLGPSLDLWIKQDTRGELGEGRAVTPDTHSVVTCKELTEVLDFRISLVGHTLSFSDAKVLIPF